MKYWSAREARSRLSELLRAAEKEPQIITYRGKPKVEVRALGPQHAGKRKTLADVLLSAPHVPEFRLPRRK